MKTVLIILFLFLVSEQDQLFTRERKFLYAVKYYQRELNITTNEEISLLVTGNRWKVAADQKEAIWQYHTKPGTRELFKDQYSIGWLLADTTGIIENDTRIWFHPPRHNQYLLTEIAPFPDFRKNMKVGSSYSMITFIGKGFGPWEGKKVKSYYSVTNIQKGTEDSLWTIKADSEIEGKTNNGEFIFSNKRSLFNKVCQS
jgi:hypothetical protein